MASVTTQDGQPQPSVLGCSSMGSEDLSGTGGSASAPDRTPDHVRLESAEEKAVLGVGGDLPPLAGGTTFGAEFVDVPRTRWKSRSQFIFVLMGYCIGVGNLWRFPYLCGKYGGGAFLVAYLIMLTTCAAPIFFYECVLGQKFQRGPAETFRKMAPRWAAIAYIPVVMVIFYLPYYQLIVAYALHYFLASFTHPLPWVDGTTPDRYLEEVVLQSRPLGSEGSGELNGRLFVEVLIVYLVTVLCLIKGIHSAGKAAYVTVILPVIMIVLLFCVCITLEGAGDGLRYYLTPRWDQLLRADVWGLAAGQIIFSLSPGTGTCISLASFHPREYKGIFADCMLVAVSNSAFSIFGGFVVFSVVGNLAHTLQKPVEEVAASGEGLAFIVFAQGLANFDGGGWQVLFSALFFLTLFLLGLDSTFAVVETLQTYVNDWVLSRNPGKKISARGNAARLVLLNGLLFLIGTPYYTRGGYYLLEVADHFVVTYSLTVGLLLEYVMIGHVYTAERMIADVEEYAGIRLPSFCLVQMKYLAPFLLSLVVLLLLASEGGLGEYPAWAILFFGVLPVLCALSFGVWPFAAFRVRRFFTSRMYSREGLEAARQRAAGGGFKTFEENDAGATPTSMAVSLSANRA